MIRPVTAVPALAMGLIAVVIWAAPAGAAVVSGSNLELNPDGSLCAYATPTSCTLTISALPAATREPGGTVAGASGVIVGWKVNAGPGPKAGTARLRVVHGTRGGGAGPVETIPNVAGTYSYPARLPVEAGDQIGLDLLEVTTSSSPVIVATTPEASVSSWKPPLGEGEDLAPETVFTNYELLMNATIEPDADHDGYGDETQDACLAVANAGAACPPPSTLPSIPPETRISKGPKGKIDAHRATFRFNSEPAGAAFQCRLDKKPFGSCRSPKTYRGLAAGKHMFRVRAVSSTGAVDPSPAKRSFRVRP